MVRDELLFFDRNADWEIICRRLPHWSQPGVVTFVTWRLFDSLPIAVIRQIEIELETLCRAEGLDPNRNLKEQLRGLSESRRSRLVLKMFKIHDRFLDQGFGACYLATRACAEIVMDSLLQFDGDRYTLTDAIVIAR
jgi:hypothetical protein